MSTSAEKLLEKMRATKHGWSEDDFKTLYTGFGFTCIGKGHNVFIHKQRPHLRATVSRHRDLPPGYAQTAVKLIDRLKKEESEDGSR